MGRRALVALLAVGLFGCATPNGSLPANGALEDDEQTNADGTPLGNVRPGAGPDDDLASAFGGQQRKSKKPDVKPPPPLPDIRAPYREAMDKARRAAGTPDFAAALATARQAAQALGPDERQAVARLALEQTSEDDAQARADAALAMLRACGPEHANACRRDALAALTKASKAKNAPKPLEKAVKALKDAEACLQKAERAKHADGCLKKAEAEYGHEKDGLGKARVAMVRADAEKVPAKKTALLEKAARACREPVCANVRRRALKGLYADARAQGDVEKAAKWALEDQAVVLSTLPEAERRWGRTKEWDAACHALEAKGAASCRAMEQKALGAYVFTDFSKQTVGQGLDGDTVRTVNAHYEATLKDCLAEQARRLTPPDAMELEVHWMVFNDGRVGEVHLRRDLDDTPVAKCLKGCFGDWRYPRYQGEWQHVEQKFMVRATEYRTFR